MLVFVIIFCAVVALGFCLASGWSDWNGMIIPNIYPLGIVITFLMAFGVASVMAPEATYFAGWKSHLIAFIVVFAATFVLFSLKMIGAGDSKLAAAIAVWVGVKGLFPFLFFTSIVGAVLGIIALYFQKKKPVEAPKEGSWIDRVQKGESAVPYGIALAIGAVIGFVQIGYFAPETLKMLAGG